MILRALRSCEHRVVVGHHDTLRIRLLEEITIDSTDPGHQTIGGGALDQILDGTSPPLRCDHERAILDEAVGIAEVLDVLTTRALPRLPAAGDGVGTRSIEPDGVPVVGWSPFGDRQDTLITGYDEEKDLVYGWSSAPAGKEYVTGSLSKWKGEGMFGYLVSRGPKVSIDRKKLEAAQLAFAVRMAHRPPLEGG